jgi:signal transduction histidine kinase/DNA-binding response OmpR family regulator/predicted RNA-binding protein with RPS1 domain
LETVKVTVERVFSFGVFVRLPDGTEGYIRQRELTWERNVDPRQLLAVGDLFEEIVLPPGDQASQGRRLELSRREALPSPWQEFFQRYRQGDVVRGQVVDIVPFGVFVEILPGVDGLVPVNDLSALGVDRPDDLLWVGDQVETVITRLGRRDRKVRLSIRQRMRQLDLAAKEAFLNRPENAGISIAQQLGVSAADVKRKIAGEPARDRARREIDPQQIGPVLVVDMDAAVRHPLVEWFRRRGYQAAEADCEAKALEILSRQSYGLILVDVDLPGGEGLSLVGQIDRLPPDAEKPVVAVMGGVGSIEEQISELEKSVAEVLVKPLDLEEVERLLSRVERGESLGLRDGWSDDMAEGVAAESFRQRAGLEAFPGRDHLSLSQRVAAILEHLVETTQAEEGLLLCVDPISHTVSILAQVGDLTLSRDALYAVEDSPVRDVIREGRWVQEGRASEKAGRFRKLLDLLPFESCVGVPVEERGDRRHALFLFHRAPQAFSRYRVRDAQAAATRMAAAIEHDKVETHLRGQQKLLLLGQLAAGFGHEVYNKVSGIELGLRNLQVDFEALVSEATGSRLKGSLGWQDLQGALEGTLRTVLDLKQTVGLFQQLTRSRHEALLDVNRVVEQATRQLQPMAYRNNVEIQSELASDLPRLAGDATQLQQIVLNLMLNAVQQMALKSKAGGMLRVRTCVHGNGRQWIAIQVEDEGPGIHKQLWEEIFSLGYSTRPGGTGLGLFVARSLAESLGGRLVVEQSVIPIGTTFLIELPVVNRNRGDAYNG